MTRLPKFHCYRKGLATALIIALSFLWMGNLHSTSAQNQETSLTGTFAIWWGDGKPGTGTSMQKFTLTDVRGQTREVLLDEALARRAGGTLDLNRTRLTLKGRLKRLPGQTRLPEALEVQSIHPPGKSPVLGEQALSGPQAWVNLLCKYADIPDEPKSLSYFNGMFGSTKPGLDHYWRELSYQNINIQGTETHGWYTLPHNRSYYASQSTTSMLSAIFQDCTAAADAAVYFPDFVGINLMINDELDGFAWGGGKYATLDGVSKVWHTTWEPPWGYARQTVIAHEMGHGFGLPHSSSFYGGSYSNEWDVMSDAYANCYRSFDSTYGCLGQHTISFHKDKLNWIPESQKSEVTSGTLSVTLERSALPQTANQKMLTIPIAGSSKHFYTVEVRRWAGYDVKLPGEGVIIHDVDTTRGQPAWVIDVDGDGDTGDEGATFTPGETYSDAANGITIAVNSETSTGYRVTLTVAGGPTPTPTIAPTPTPTPTPPPPTPTPTPTPVLGDANNDGKVDGEDYIIWLNNYNAQTSNGASDGDFNSDGFVDGVDYVIWLNNYGAGVGIQ